MIELTRKSFYRMSVMSMLLLAYSGSYAQAPANDLCSGAIMLTPGFSCSPMSGTTVGATTSGDSSPDCERTGNQGDVWYSFVAGELPYKVFITDFVGASR